MKYQSPYAHPPSALTEIKTRNKPGSEADKFGVAMFMLAGLSFVPRLGIILGIICIVIALTFKKDNSRILIFLSVMGILSTVLVYHLFMRIVSAYHHIQGGVIPHFL